MDTTLASILIGVSSAVIAGLFKRALEMNFIWQVVMTLALTTYGISIMEAAVN